MRRRTVAGRSVVVIPVATTVGWELEVESQVVVVTSVQPASGDQPETITVQDSSGSTSTMEVVREDTADNGVELEGTEVEEEPAATQTAPSEAPPPSDSGCSVATPSAAGAAPLVAVGLAMAVRRAFS